MRQMQFRQWVFIFVCAAMAFASMPLEAAKGQRRKFDAVLAKRLASGSNISERVIVRVAPHKFTSLRASLRAAGHRFRKEHRNVSALTLNVPRAALAGLINHPDVLSVSADVDIQTQMESTSSSDVTQYLALRETLGLTANAPTGDGIGVAVVDSGIHPSPDLAGRITAFYDFTNGQAGVPAAPSDQFGHGTHVAGLIAASGAMSGGAYQGVAPSVRLIGLKALDGEGQGSTSDVLAAIEFATANKNALGIDVLNLSLGHPIFESADTDPLVQAVQSASAAGIIVVVSAGNVGVNPDTGETGYAGILSPGNAPSAITVGSEMTFNTKTREDDRVGRYSSRGPSWIDGYAKPDIIAPGHRLTSLNPPGGGLGTAHPSLLVGVNAGPDLHISLTGTSMAAAVTSGMVAVMLEANRDLNPQAPKLTANAVKAIRQFTSTEVLDETGVPYNMLIQGTGGLNGHGALLMAQSTRPLKQARTG